LTRLLRVLHLEDSPRDAEIVRHRLHADGLACNILVAKGKDSFEAALAGEPFDLIISDYNLPGYDGVAALKQAQKIQPDVPVILISGTVGEDEAVKCLHIGATDYLLKERLERLVPAVQRAIQEAHTRLERRQADAAVREERDRAQRYLDMPEVILLALDSSGRITLPNRYACSVLGWAAHELIGRDWIATCIPPGIREALTKRFHNLIAGDLSAIAENAVLTRSGEERLIEWRNTLLRDDAGHVIGTFSSGTDITERRRAEIALRKTTADLLERTNALEQHATALRGSEERTNYALGAARMGVWEVDLLTQQFTWSETMAPVFGLTREQAPTSLDGFLALIHPDDRRLVENALTEAARLRTDFKEEFRVLWPDGTSHWIAGQARMLRHADDEPAHWLGIGTDISDRKSLEAQFRQAQKMEAVGQLAGGVAHDFNNLLTAILGYSNFVIDTFGPQDRRRADLEEVIKAGQRAAALTRQLLAFSRRQVLQPSAVDLNGLVTGMRQMLSRLIGEHVDLVPILAPDLGAVRADPGQLEQVLMNLVVNARDAMPSGGRLAIETANVELDESFMQDVVIHPGSYVMLAVSDSGIGMDEATKQQLFEPFFTTKDPGKGTGLGLATVYGIVKQSGGYIWVFSEPGKGATFKVYLPRASGDIEVEKSTVSEEMAVGTETVLIVEDEEAVRLLTRRILEEAGYRVFDAANPEQAEALFAQNRNLFNLLVTDVIMPGSSGPKLFERLAQLRPDLKVLYVSGYTDDTIVHQGQLDPGVALLQKPFTADALNRRIREVLDR
jgi:PAS domain S-box-containing protein